ncbi:MAG: ActS/PrrB/RegB family redox-sensitive histidine kinase [Magnetospirillum sp.]|nr:ActS/PrrB/RegB family redox-sensitive histidine kinase [Magnetospirillum sp.]
MTADGHAECRSGSAGVEETPHLQTRLGTLVQIRWLAIVGQGATIAVVDIAFGGFAMAGALATVAASAALNLWLTFSRGILHRIDERTAAWHLAFDLAQLTVLLGLTGGLHNPFALFLLAPVTVAAATLSARLTVRLAAGAIAAASLVAAWHEPLPWPEGPLNMPPLYLLGMWLALTLGVVSVAFFTWRMAEEARRIAEAYSASRIALAQEQRLAEMGALAAAVAHELNTPLATVHLVARELAEELPGDSPLQADIRTLIGQAERCRDTLARLTRSPGRDAAVESETIAFPVLVELAAHPHVEGARCEVVFSHAAALTEPGGGMPWLERSPEILHGIGNFVQNAIQFARSRVEITTGWGEALTVRIADDGPGFSPQVLERMGEPYISTRGGDGNHLGLGVFIAATLLARTGARVTFANREAGGAEVMVTWTSGEVG